jgi:hypothetical protein
MEIGSAFLMLTFFITEVEECKEDEMCDATMLKRINAVDYTNFKQTGLGTDISEILDSVPSRSFLLNTTMLSVR